MNWRYQNTVLALMAAGNFVQFGSRVIISPVIPDVIDAFGASKSTVGLALTGMWAAYALLQYPSGVFGDRYGERPLMLAALGLTAAGSLLLAGAPSFLAFGVFAVLMGAGTSLFFPVGASLLTRLFENRGHALSYLTAGGALAGLVLPVIAAAIAVRFGWRVALLLGAAIALPVFVLSALLVRPTDPRKPDRRLREGFRPGTVIDLLSRPSVAYTTVVAVLLSFAWNGFTTFFPTFLIEHRGLSTQYAGAAFGAVFLLSTAAQPVMGRVSDARSRDTAISISVLTAAGGFGVLLFGPTVTSTVVGVAVLGAGISWAGVVQARFMDALPGGSRGTGYGLVRMVYLLLGSLGSVVIGTLADVAGWATAFGLVMGLLVAVFAVLSTNRTLGLGL